MTASVHCHTCSVCFVIIKYCSVVAASYQFLVGIRGSITHFFPELVGNPFPERAKRKPWSWIAFLAIYSLFHCDLTPLTFDLYSPPKPSVLQSWSYLEIRRELNRLYFILVVTLWQFWTDLCVFTLLVGRQEGHPACKKLGVGMLVVMIWLELCTAYSSSCNHRFHRPLLQWTSAIPGSPGRWPLKLRVIYKNMLTLWPLVMLTRHRYTWKHNLFGRRNYCTEEFLGEYLPKFTGKCF